MNLQTGQNPQQLSILDLLDYDGEKKIEELSSDDWLSILKTATTQYNAKITAEKAERKRIAEEEKKRIEEEEKRQQEEYIAEITCMDLPLDWNNLYSTDERAAGIHVDSISDGLILSLTTLGAVDIEYISQISQSPYKEVIETLRGSIFQNPDRWNKCFYQGWETADEYLSGNLMRKYKSAQAANEMYRGYFADNIKAIEAVLPEPIPTADIYVTLGSPWVPPDVIDDFIEDLLGKFNGNYRDKWPVEYEPVTCTWNIPYKVRYKYSLYSVKSTQTYGTERMPALYIIEKTLNMKALQVFDKVPSKTTKSGEKRVLNKQETIALQEKQQLIIKKFQEWIWTDPRRKERLEMIYENNFSCVRRRIFDGSFLTFPGMSPKINLYPYQKNAVARILFSPNTLLAHDVGAGKTYMMIAAGMELRRMGISEKNIYVVPNNIVGQWKSFFELMYPQVQLMTVTPKDFTPKKRQDVLKTIYDGNFDAIIIAYSCFELIPMSKAYYEQEIEKELGEIKKALANNHGNSRLRNKKEALEKKLTKIRDALLSSIPDICFDDLKINTMFLDEAHNYKNLSVETKIDKVLGINRTGSTKCNEMLDKIRCVQRMNNGRGMVFATGTPITNSVTDIFVMQTYLQYGELRFLDLHHFDNWAATFGEKVTEFEIDVDTSTYRLATRFSKFHNLPELTNLLAQVADFHKVDKTNDLPDFGGYDDKLISKTPELSGYLVGISKRAEMIRQGSVQRTVDNMLKLTTDGRKAALDMRLADPVCAFTCDCKVFRCMENVLTIYKRTSDRRLTQLVFCDTSTPKAGFNIYHELKKLLVHYGVPDEEIAFVHYYETEKLRTQLFAKIQNGEIRVLLGSTFKLGMGVNVQKKLVALHHLDVPWRPADMTQREGRILRQGNENDRIQIFRYITDGSFDAYSWQLLESKQRFICQLLSGTVTDRSASDVDDIVLNYAEIKALAVGNPLVKERVETANALNRARLLHRKFVETRLVFKKEQFQIPGKIMHCQLLIEKALLDKNRYAANRIEIKEMKDHRNVGGKILSALNNYAEQQGGKTILFYQGFNIVLPDNMLKEKPYVWLEGAGRYDVEMGESDIGCISRIDNKLNSLPEYIDRQKQELQYLEARKSDIETELKKDSPYADEIENLREKLRSLDEKLGVDKK